MKKVRWLTLLGVIGGMVVVLCGLTAGGYSPLLWLNGPRQRISVLIPDGYVGPVLIAYEVPDGVTAERQGDTLIYHVPLDGALLLKDTPFRSINSVTFMYESRDGSTRTITPSSCFQDSPQTEVVVCTGMTVLTWNMKDLRPNQTYYITRPIDQRQRETELNQLIKRYLDRLAISP